MNMPIDLHVFKEGNNWFGLTVNSENNTITRFEFSNSFSNTPKAINLGNIGSLSYPTGIYAINDNGYWRVFVVNGGDNTRTNAAFSLTRLDFGSSLLNTPTGVNLGNPGNFLKHPRDLTIFKQCGQIVGFAVNGHFSNSDLIRMDFGTSLSSVPSLSSLGAIGNTSFPHSISKLFRVNEEVYGFVTNVDNNTVTRLRFSGCTNASTPGSQVRNPNPIMYNRAGIYNVNLTVDEGMPTQNAFCKQVVVVPSVHSPVQLKTICAGDSVLLSSTATNGNQWNTGVTEKTIYTKAAGIYWVKSINAGGCMSIDSFKVDVKPMPTVALGRDTSMCNKDSIVLNAGNAGASYLWQNGQTSQHHIASRQGLYFVTVTKDGCITKDSIFISMLPLPMVSIGGKTTICKDGSTELTASGGGNFSWSPATGLSHPFAAVTTASPQVTTKYVLTVTGQNACKAKDSVVISVMPKPVFTATVSRPVLCLGDTVLLTAGGGDSYTWSPTSTLATPGSQITQAFPIKTTSYKVVIENSNCGIKDSIFVRVPVVNKPKVKTTKSNDINCYIGQAQLSTGGGNIYSWKPATGLSDPSSSQPIVRTHTTITYHVSITTAEGCIVEDSITVNVVKGDDGSGFLVPAAFTPNNDGKNDCFGVKYWGEVKDFSMNIYNRWGELLFHADQPSQCWNGMYKGQLQPSDVYVYLIKGKTMCGDIFRKGTVVLVK
jgi:gliding motility-associated-like protein